MSKNAADCDSGRGSGSGRVRPRVERMVVGAGKRSKRVGLGRPVEIAKRPGELLEMVLGAVVIGVDRAVHAVRL